MTAVLVCTVVVFGVFEVAECIRLLSVTGVQTCSLPISVVLGRCRWLWVGVDGFM